MLKRVGVAAALIGAMVLILVLYHPAFRPQPPGVTQVEGAGTVSIGGPFTLRDPDGNIVTETNLKGRYSLVFFGFTHCPDICPLTLQNVTQALNDAGEAANAVQPVFITVDPERDTPEAMRAYAANFHPRLLALTGTPEQVQAAVKSYRAYAAKSPLKDAEGRETDDYTMIHTGNVYLMDRNGNYVTHFGQDATAAIITERLLQTVRS
jgi:protein SCO1/2